MPAPINLTGHVYKRLLVLYEELPATYPRKWVCRCDCGVIKTIIGASLRSGLTQSCGCLNREIVSKQGTLHGECTSRLYTIWANMKQRCENPKHTHYHYYGARGITVSADWATFIPFKDWAESAGYSLDFSIDRIDGNLGYSPSNCRWVNKTIQSRNQKVRNTNKSGYTGVSFVPRLAKYQAYLTVNYKKVNLGFFVNPEDAYAARTQYIASHNLLGFPTN